MTRINYVTDENADRESLTFNVADERGSTVSVQSALDLVLAARTHHVVLDPLVVVRVMCLFTLGLAYYRQGHPLEDVGMDTPTCSRYMG